jgi:hypothetical protein
MFSNSMPSAFSAFINSNMVKRSFFSSGNKSDYVRLSNSGVKIVFGVSFPYALNDGKIFTDLKFAQEETSSQLDFYNDLEKRSEGKVKIIKSKTDLDFVLNNENVLGLVMLEKK